MEIREQKSPFEACGKDAVQEWLVHPVTVAMRANLMGTVEKAERDAIESLRNFPDASMTLETTGACARNMGSVLLGLDEAVKLFDQAKEYANAQG